MPTEVLRSNTFEEWRQATNTISSDLGTKADLSANITSNTSLVTAINELQSDIGVVGNLTTVATNLVSAVNEVKDSTITFSGAKTFNESLNLAATKVFTINGTTVLSATGLGSGVTGSSLTSVGTIGTGTWQGSVVGSTYGGTGVNNGGRTITLNTGNLTLTAQSGGSVVTVPSTGTLATLAGNETLTNKSVNLANNTLTGTLVQFNTALSDDDFAALSAAQTLTNKTITLGANTITGTLAQFNAALTDDDFAALAASQTLTNKTVNLANNTVTGTLAQFNVALSDDDFAALSAAQTLTNKSLVDSSTYFVASADNTKKVLLQLSGLTTNTIRTLTVPNASGTIALAADVHYIGTTSVALNRASANLALTGISSVALPGSTSGTVTLQPAAVAGTSVLTLPGVTGTIVTTGDTGSITNGMIADTTIQNAKLANKSVTITAGSGMSGGGSVDLGGTITLSNADKGSSQNIFKNFAVSGQTTIAAASNNETLTVVAGTVTATAGIVLTTDNSAKSLTITHADTSSLGSTNNSGAVVIQNITVDTYGHVTAVTTADASSALSAVYQPLDGDLTAIGAISDASTGYLRKTAANTWLLDTSVVTTSAAQALTNKTYNNLTLTALATGFTVAGGTASKTLTVNNTLSLSGTDSSTLNIGTGGTLGTAAFTAATAYAPAAGSSSITTLGTVGTGTWQASTISTSYTDAKIVSVSGTSNQITATTTLGAVSLALPQDISSTSAVNFGKTFITTSASTTTQILKVVNSNTAYINGKYPDQPAQAAQLGNDRFIVDELGNVEIRGDLYVRGGTTITGATSFATSWGSVTSKPQPIYTVSLSGGDITGSGSSPSATEVGTSATIAVNATIGTGKVTETKIADLAVTAAKIADSTIVLGKLDAGIRTFAVNTSTGLSGGASVNLGQAVTLTNTDRGSSQYIFKNIAVAGQSTVVADQNDDTLTLAAGQVDTTSGITITTDAINDTITITHANTSSAASVSSDNSNGVVIQDVVLTLDTYGHVTAASVGTTDLDSRYVRPNTSVSLTDLTLTGNLTVNGTTTAINTTTLDVVDLNITVAKNATTAAAANGAGLTFGTITGGSPTMLYTSVSDRVVFNRGVEGSSFVRTGGTSSQFLKADGSVDSNTYATTAQLPSVGNGTITISAAGSLSGGGNFTVNQSGNSTITLTGPAVNDGTLGVSIGTPGATNTTVTWGTATGFSANTASAYTYDLKVGPALTALAASMTGAGSGFLKKTAGDTYSIDTNTYLTGNQTITLGTDLTGSGTTALNATINNGAVTLAKMANLAANSIIGNNTGSAATPIALSVGNVQTMLGLGSAAYTATSAYQPAGTYVTSIGATSPLAITGAATTPSVGFIVQSPNTVLAGPSSGATSTAPTFRALVNADLPTSGVSASTYNNVTVNDRGIVTSGSNVSYLTTSAAASTYQPIGSYVDTSTAQTVGGIKTFSAAPVLTAGGSLENFETNGFAFKTGTGGTASTRLLIGFPSTNLVRLTAGSSTNLRLQVTGGGMEFTTGTGDLAIDKNVTVNGTTGVTAAAFIKSGGTSSQFLKADGSVDSNSYALTSSIPTVSNSTVSIAAGTGLSGGGSFTVNQSGNTTVTLTNAGVTSLITGVGTLTGGVTIAGSSGLTLGIEAGNTLRFTNSGVTAIAGTTNQITASASTGSVTLSLPQSINTGASVQFGSLGIGTAASGVAGEIRATDNVTAYYTSDERLKTNVTKIENALEKVSQIDGVIYDWNDVYKEKHGGVDGFFVREQNSGVIAQQVEKVFPNVVGERGDGYKAVRYELLVPLLIEAIKDLKAEVEALKAQK